MMSKKLPTSRDHISPKLSDIHQPVSHHCFQSHFHRFPHFQSLRSYGTIACREPLNKPNRMPKFEVGSARLVAATTVATTSASFHFGFQLAVINDGIQPLQRFVNSSFIENYNTLGNHRLCCFTDHLSSCFIIVR